MQTFAILGSQPDLSMAEITAQTGAIATTSAGEVALFEDLQGNFIDLLSKLGGTQKIGYVIGEVAKVDGAELIAFLTSQLEQETRETKLHFGISIYDFGQTSAVQKLYAQSRIIGMTVKSNLKTAGRSARFVMSKEPALNAVSVAQNDLIAKGAEFVLLAAKDKVVIGMTSAVQDANDWSERDFGRPRRNAKQGMLPPKLARMMINLTGTSAKNKSILDPFCGSGTVLMEGAMLGAAKVIGSDIASGAVHDTQHNMAWLKERGIKVGEVDVFMAKASEVSNRLPENTVDMIITETYLGLPRRGVETTVDLYKAVDYIETLYTESFSTLRGVLKENGIVIIAAPVHYLDGQTFEAPVVRILEGLGYTHSPLPHEPLIYHREGQLVGRRFFRFTK